MKCGRKDTIVEKKISEEKRRNIQCSECRTEKKQPWWNWRMAVHPEQEKMQQSSIQAKAPKGTAKEKGEQREVRRTFKMLREVQLNIGIEKVNMYEGITVKVLLDSGATGMLIDRKIVAKHGFRLQKLERPVTVRDVNGMNNSTGAITYQVEVNVYYKSHVERMRMDIYNLGKTEVILGIPWLQAHNPEINCKTREVKIIRCPLLCRRSNKKEENKKTKREKRVAILEEERIVRQAVDDKEDWGKRERSQSRLQKN